MKSREEFLKWHYKKVDCSSDGIVAANEIYDWFSTPGDTTEDIRLLKEATHKLNLLNSNLPMSDESPVAKLVFALKTDEGYRQTWKANIAMAFKDEFSRSQSRLDLHEIANRAADNFLNLLLSTPTPQVGDEEIFSATNDYALNCSTKWEAFETGAKWMRDKIGGTK